jgi:hypothetical protein
MRVTSGGLDMRLPRITIRSLMIAVAATSLLFVVARLANELKYWTLQNGWNTSVLRAGQRVIICEQVRFGDAIIPAGSRGLVVGDLTDEDSAYPYRDVSVEVIEGRQKGAFGTVARSLLRVQ